MEILELRKHTSKMKKLFEWFHSRLDTEKKTNQQQHKKQIRKLTCKDKNAFKNKSRGRKWRSNRQTCHAPHTRARLEVKLNWRKCTWNYLLRSSWRGDIWSKDRNHLETGRKDEVLRRADPASRGISCQAQRGGTAGLWEGLFPEQI